MIQVNLLPGSAASSRGGSSVDVRAAVERATAGIRDKFLMAAIVCVGGVTGASALLFASQASLASTLGEMERSALQDSSRYSVMLAAQASAAATRDSLHQQVALIRSIDDSRYLWPHLLEEISNALPQYTWLTAVRQTSTPPSSAAPDAGGGRRAAGQKTAETAEEKRKRAEAILTEAARATKFRIIGRTVDIQALTLFMKTLEASPFIQNVQLTRSDLVLVDSKEVTEFQLEAESQKPPPFLLRTVSLSLGDR